jgi:hypothetical protein
VLVTTEVLEERGGDAEGAEEQAAAPTPNEARTNSFIPRERLPDTINITNLFGLWPCPRPECPTDPEIWGTPSELRLHTEGAGAEGSRELSDLF